MLKNQIRLWITIVMFVGSLVMLAFLILLMMRTNQCHASQEKKSTPYDKDIQEIVKSSKACTDKKSVREGKCSHHVGKDILSVDQNELKKYDKEVHEIATSSKSCMDARSVSAGKCVRGMGKDIFRLKETEFQQTKISTSEIIVFVSLSMPTASLKSIHHDLERVGGRMVIRGLVEGSFKKTQERMSQLGISVDVDPPLFEQYAIKQVPVTMNRSGETEFDFLQGNIRLEAALEAFSKRGDYPLQATHHLQKLRGESQ